MGCIVELHWVIKTLYAFKSVGDRARFKGDVTTYNSATAFDHDGTLSPTR